MSKGISATIPFLLASMAIMGQPAIAEDYPLRPMTVFGTTPAGTSVDLTTRFFGERIKAATGQPWVVENKPGAGGAIAAKAAATSRPDGYTMIVGSSGSQAADKFLFKDLPYDPVKDFVPVARMFRLDFVLAVNPEKIQLRRRTDRVSESQEGPRQLRIFLRQHAGFGCAVSLSHRHHRISGGLSQSAADDE